MTGQQSHLGQSKASKSSIRLRLLPEPIRQPLESLALMMLAENAVRLSSLPDGQTISTVVAYHKRRHDLEMDRNLLEEALG